jgi:HSP20 family protein
MENRSLTTRDGQRTGSSLWDWDFGQNWLSNMFPMAQSTSRRPVVDVSENDKEVSVRAELPGMADKDVSVTCEDGVLYISGQKSGEHEQKEGENVRYRESWTGSFSRSLYLGNTVDWNKADASFKDGVLTVKLPKSPAGESRKKIAVKT